MKKIYITLIVLTISCFAAAQAPSQQDVIQRRQFQDAQDLLRQQEMERSIRSIAEQPAAAPAQSAGTAVSEEGCLDIAGLNLSGIKLIKIDDVKAHVSGLIGPCITKEILQQIQSDIQKMYVDKGYIASRVYFDFSNLHNKRLNIVVHEGRLEEIVLADADGEPQKGFGAYLRKTTAFPFTIGKPLNLRDIEQGLEQMNRLQSNNATMDIRPGSDEGDSVVVVSNPTLPKNQISLSYDNSGSSNTGIYRGSGTYSRDNLLSLNENIFLNATTTLWNNRDLRYSDNYTGSITAPFGYWTASASFNYSNYLTTTRGAMVSFESSGNATNATASLERMLLRGGRHKLAAGAQLMMKESNNYLEDVFIKTSSRTLTVGTLYMTGTYFSPIGSFFSKLSLNRGLPIFGAKKDTVKDKGVPKAEFTTIGLYLNFARNFGVFNYSLNLNGQYSFDDLFASEQIMAGGESSVRGFKEYNIFGESGFYARQDIKTPFATFIGMTENDYLNTMLQNLFIGAFFDYGFTAPKTYGHSASLAGTGGRISYYGKYLSGGFTYARALYSPAWVPAENNVFYFNVALNLTF